MNYSAVKDGKDPEIKANNLLIGKFMGEEINAEGLITNDNGRSWCGIFYHASWDELMPVWEKIGKLKSKNFSVEEMEITRKKCWIKALAIPYERPKLIALNFVEINECKTLIEATYKSVVEFIKWYNEQVA